MKDRRNDFDSLLGRIIAVIEYDIPTLCYLLSLNGSYKKLSVILHEIVTLVWKVYNTLYSYENL